MATVQHKELTLTQSELNARAMQTSGGRSGQTEEHGDFWEQTGVTGRKEQQTAIGVELQSGASDITSDEVLGSPSNPGDN